VSAERPVTEEQVQRYLNETAAVTRRAAAECAGSIVAAASLISAALRGGGKLLLCGNGGSAADCQHLAAEFVNVLDPTRPRPALAAIALTTDTALLTAIANDVAFEQVFQRQLEALGRKGDVLVGITTSGNSANVLRALTAARNAGIGTIVLTGEGGGKAAGVADVAVRVPSRDTAHIQETHLAVGHILCELVERQLFAAGHGD
jgi:D-sedoheptulose 7-phosphate isomerase